MDGIEKVRVELQEIMKIYRQTNNWHTRLDLFEQAKRLFITLQILEGIDVRDGVSK
jgi:hypothetical protein